MEPKRITAVVLSPAGGGLSGLDVEIDGQSAEPCGSGCYVGRRTPRRGRSTVRVAGFGPTQTVRFALPAQAPPAMHSCAAPTAAYRSLRSVTYRERLAADETDAHRRALAAREPEPHRVHDRRRRAGHRDRQIAAGTATRRTAHGSSRSRRRSLSRRRNGQYATNAHVIAQTPSTTTVSFADPTIPAYFTVTFDRKTLRPRVMHMTAASHFMTDTYLGFN